MNFDSLHFLFVAVLSVCTNNIFILFANFNEHRTKDYVFVYVTITIWRYFLQFDYLFSPAICLSLARFTNDGTIYFYVHSSLPSYIHCKTYSSLTHVKHLFTSDQVLKYIGVEMVNAVTRSCISIAQVLVFSQWIITRHFPKMLFFSDRCLC